jgi:hypothetical protein
MNSNFEWQKHQAHERVQGALQDALAHRLSRQGTTGRSRKSPYFKTILLMGMIWLLIGLLLSGCTPTKSAYAESQGENAPIFSEISSAVTMADIRIQDRLWEQALASGQAKPVRPNLPMSMAERIQFKERVLDLHKDSRTIERSLQETSTWNMADRIRFQDRLESR